MGQEEAVKAVLPLAIRRSRVQINLRRRPASFIFVGPTGTGKTELVRVLSKELFDSPRRSSASICRSSWKSTRSRRSSDRPRAMSAG